MKAVEDMPTVYLFVGRKVKQLCLNLFRVIGQSLDVFVPMEIRTGPSLFQYLMELSSQKPFNLVIIDEFQEFYNINESVYSDMQTFGYLIGRNADEFDCIGFRLFVDAENISEQ